MCWSCLFLKLQLKKFTFLNFEPSFHKFPLDIFPADPNVLPCDFSKYLTVWNFCRIFHKICHQVNVYELRIDVQAFRLGKQCHIHNEHIWWLCLLRLLELLIKFVQRIFFIHSLADFLAMCKAMCMGVFIW